MHPADIQAALKKKGITQLAIAREIAVTPTSVSDTINKKRISDRVMKVIAEKIGRDIRRVFPEYYNQPPKRKTSKSLGLK
jgi:lambda repressor-like predicted transcriptional regulator